MKCREIILKGAAKQEWKGIDAAVPSAPSLPIGFTKQNLRGIGRMTNSTLNKFAGVVKQYLRLVITLHFLSPCAQKTVSVSQLSLHNCPFIFLVLALCAFLFPFHSLRFPFLLLYFFTFRRSPFLFYSFTFLIFESPLFNFLIFYFFTFISYLCIEMACVSHW